MKQVIDRTRKATDPQVLFAGGGEWSKFEKYELEFDVSGRAVRLLPKRGAGLTTYRPFDKYPAILEDYLKLAADSQPRPVLSSSSTDADVRAHSRDGLSRESHNRRARRTLEFVNKYGPLGIFWECADHFYIRGDGDEDQEFVYVDPKGQLLDVVFGSQAVTGAIPFENYVKPFSTPKLNQVGHAFLRAQRRDEKFLRYYAEPVLAIARHATDLLWDVKEWHRFREGKFQPGDPYVDENGVQSSSTIWEQRLPNFCRTGLAIRFTAREGGPESDTVAKHVTIDYTFRSLAAALRLLFVLNQASEVQPVRLCALTECGEPFIARNERGRYCSESHSNRDRQRRFIESKNNK